jgi:hypothetical protein
MSDKLIAVLANLPVVEPVGHGRPDHCSVHGDIPRNVSIVEHINADHDISYKAHRALEKIRDARSAQAQSASENAHTRAEIARLRAALLAARPWVNASTAPNTVIADLDAALTSTGDLS